MTGKMTGRVCLVAAVVVFALIAGAFAELPMVALESLLKSTGLDQQKFPITEGQRVLITKIGDIYKEDAELSDEERMLLGSFFPDTKGKIMLKALFNQRLVKSLSIELLLTELTKLNKELAEESGEPGNSGGESSGSGDSAKA